MPRRSALAGALVALSLVLAPVLVAAPSGQPLEPRVSVEARAPKRTLWPSDVRLARIAAASRTTRAVSVAVSRFHRPPLVSGATRSVRAPQATTEAPIQADPPNLAANRALGETLAAARGWVGDEWACLDRLFGPLEGGWNQYADNPHSSAYGIPQALPGSKMASHGADWRTNPETQVRWGLDYVAGRYGSPCAAMSHRLRRGWY